jgi:pimeloyl-ACP methyl ester carboxylesterase
MRRAALIVPALLLALGLFTLSACSPARVIESWRVLHDIAAGPNPSTFKEATPAPARVAVAYQVAGRAYGGDLYRPGEAAKARLVLVPGAAEAGKDDPRLVAFAETFARARFTVLVPDIVNLRELKVAPSDVRAIADALRHLSSLDGPAPAPLGLAAISYAAGPAILAALEPDVREELGFILAIGGYHDIEGVVTFFTTGHFREAPGQAWQRREPNAYGRWVFVRVNAPRVADARDRVLLASMAERKLRDLAAPVDDLAAKLGREGGSFHALLENRDPEAVPSLIASLPPAIRNDMAALDLARRDLTPLRANVILIHGRDDAIIPYTESAALAAALPEGQASLCLVDNLAHVDLGPGGLLDGLRLWRATYRILAERDAVAE